jgi:hypothetical protein
MGSSFELKSVTVFLLLLFVSVSGVYGESVEKNAHSSIPDIDPILILTGGSEDIRLAIESSGTKVLKAINRYEPGDDFSLPAAVAAPNSQGVTELDSLLSNSRFFVTREVNESTPYKLFSGAYEIRNIDVRLVKDANPGAKELRRELILIFGEDGTLLSVRFALDTFQFRRIVNNSKDNVDEYRRRLILSYLEQFRTAYNRKDIDFIEQQFSPQALIITGVKVERSDKEELQMNTDTPEYQYFRKSKEEYVRDLKNIFRSRKYVDVRFNDIEIKRHERYPEIYAINLYQLWNTYNITEKDGYSDEGFLFLLIDFENEDRPEIYVRVWQEDSMVEDDKSNLVDASFFDVIK